jgi:acetyltransferase
MYTIEKLSSEQAESAKDDLVELLQDTVQHGASVGFVCPLTADIARQYWQDVIKEVGQGSRILLVLHAAGRLVGSVQLGLCMRLNGKHRAEVQKLFVHTSARRHGFGRALMAAVELEAKRSQRSLLYLDTEPHKPAEAMYRKLGWSLAGEIPDYASSPDGHLHSTMIFYKKIAA